MVAIHFYSHRDYLFTQNHYPAASAEWRCIGRDIFFSKGQAKANGRWLAIWLFHLPRKNGEKYINVVLYSISIHLGIHLTTVNTFSSFMCRQ